MPEQQTIPSVENRVCDYEGSQYRTDFWEGRGRQYEDLVERAVMTRLLPPRGRRLMEVGAAYGRLANLYDGYEKVVLLDYSFSQLQQARQTYGDERFVYVAANAYHMPFQSGVFDAVTMIRVLHHFENVPDVITQIRRVTADQGTFLLEFANKRNLKALLRHAAGGQGWNPNDLDPVEFVELNFNFHPIYIAHALYRAGFDTRKRVPVSFLRLNALKQHIPNAWLAEVDGVLQGSGWLVSPSVFTLNTARAAQSPVNQVHLADEDIFACPLSGATLTRTGELLVSAAGVRWAIRDGIYDFKEPVV